MNWPDLAAAIRAQRLALGLTQEDVAWTAGVGRNTPSRIERGRGNPGICTVLAVAAAVDLDLHPRSGVDTDPESERSCCG